MRILSVWRELRTALPIPRSRLLKQYRGSEERELLTADLDMAEYCGEASCVS